MDIPALVLPWFCTLHSTLHTLHFTLPTAGLTAGLHRPLLKLLSGHCSHFGLWTPHRHLNWTSQIASTFRVLSFFNPKSCAKGASCFCYSVFFRYYSLLFDKCSKCSKCKKTRQDSYRILTTCIDHKATRYHSNITVRYCACCLDHSSYVVPCWPWWPRCFVSAPAGWFTWRTTWSVWIRRSSPRLQCTKPQDMLLGQTSRRNSLNES